MRQTFGEQLIQRVKREIDLIYVENGIIHGKHTAFAALEELASHLSKLPSVTKDVSIGNNREGVTPRPKEPENVVYDPGSVKTPWPDGGPDES